MIMKKLAMKSKKLKNKKEITIITPEENVFIEKVKRKAGRPRKELKILKQEEEEDEMIPSEDDLRVNNTSVNPEDYFDKIEDKPVDEEDEEAEEEEIFDKVKQPVDRTRKHGYDHITSRKNDKIVNGKTIYVDSKEFTDLIKKYYKNNKLNDNLAEMVYKIAARFSFHPGFINYSFKEEMVGDAVIKMMSALKNKKFNPTKGNSFSYFSKIAFNAFRNRIKKEKKNREALQTYQQEVYNTLIEEGHIPSQSSHSDCSDDCDSYSDN